MVVQLTHFPIELGNRIRHINLHGHIHSNKSNYKNQFNVGLDSLMVGKLGKKFGDLFTLKEILDWSYKTNTKIAKKKNKLFP